MKHYGDITKISGFDIPLVDIVTGGSPCQDLSVAGKRAGLEGERSGLFMEQIRIIKEMREHDKRNRGADVDFRLLRPRFMVWENVPGAFSSNKGEDFRCVLEETAKIVCEDAIIPEPPKGKWSPSGCIMGDGWSIAWRVHDAQFWGVPQRRKRIALVADFGGSSAPEILFERESVSGDSEQSEQEREKAAGAVGESINPSSYTLKIRGGCEVDSHGKKAGKGALIQTELSGTLGVSQDQTLITNCLNSWDVQSKHIQPQDGVAEALYSGECRGGGGESYVMQEKEPILLESNQNHATIQTDGVSTALPASMGMGGGYVPMVCGINGDVAGTHDSSYYKGCGERQGIEREVVIQDAYGFEPGVAKRLDPENRFVEETAPTLRENMGDNQTSVVYGISSYDSNAMKSDNPNSGIYEAETSRTLDNNGGNPACNQGGMIVLEGNGSRESHKGDGYKESEVMYSLNTVEQHAVCIGNGQVAQLKVSEKAGALNCMHDQQAVLVSEVDESDAKHVTYGLDRASFNQGKNAQYDFSVEEELAQPIVARGPGGVLSNR